MVLVTAPFVEIPTGPGGAVRPATPLLSGHREGFAMSRTHKTKPFWVKMKQGHLATEEVHDHTEAPCDLPPQVELDEWQRKRHCRHSFRYTGISTCGPSCHCWGGEVPPAKRERLSGKHIVSTWEDEYVGEAPCSVGEEW